MNIHLALLLVYSVLLSAIGLWIARSVRGTADFFVARRRLSAPLIFSTVLAANIGAGNTVGTAGLAYTEGVSAWWWIGSAGLGSLVLAFLVGPRIWRLSTEHGFYTAGDYLEFRYGPALRGVIASLIWAGTLALLAAQLVAGAAVLHVVAGTSLLTGALIGGVLMLVYFVAGGLLSSAWVNMVQLVVLVGGFLVAVPMLYARVGAGLGTSQWPEGYWNFLHSSGAGSGWAWIAVLAPAFIVSPGLMQKTYGARDERAVRMGIGAQAVGLMAFGLLPVFFGIAARAARLDIATRELVLPTVLASELPPLVGAIGLAAIFSAEVSTCDAILFMLSTSLSQDLYKRFVNPAATDARLLAVARLAAVLGGIGGIVLAVALGSVITALAIFYSLVGVSLFVPVLAGLYTQRGGNAAAFASVAAGIGVLLAVHVSTGGRGVGVLSPNVIALAAAAAAYVVVAAIAPRDGVPRHVPRP